MPVYNAPEIKDRVATGDDLYTITDVGRKKKLTPSPTEVAEPGTPINKALLQGIVDALQAITGSFVPYDLYWWRRRPSANSYAETQQTAFVSSNSTTGYGGSIIPFFYHGENADFNSSVSFQTASSITINQSNGAVSLKNPTSRTVKYADYDATALNNMCAGKYIKFTSDYTGVGRDEILYVPSEAYIRSYSVASSATSPTRDYIGYLSPTGNWGGWGPGTDVKLIGSVKQTAIGDWELISSDASDTYPHSGASGGYEYVYFGKVSDAALSRFAPSLKTVNITSASYKSNSFTVDLPGSVCLFWCDAETAPDGGVPFGAIVDDTFVYMVTTGVSYSSNYGATYGKLPKSGSVAQWEYYPYDKKTQYKLCKAKSGRLYFGTANGNTDNKVCTLYLLPIIPR
jgi:hypothetical protein